MGLTEIRFTERDLASMPRSLRDALLVWYVDRQELLKSEQIAEDLKDLLNADEEEDRQLKFQEFMAAGVIQPMDEIVCKPLKRHRKILGEEDFIRGALMTEAGTAVFQNREYSTPSQLAIAMANSVQGAKPVKALNGYQYLYAQLGDGTYSLGWLRMRVVRKEKQERAMQYAVRAIVAADNPLHLCPSCKAERHEESRKEIPTSSGPLVIVTLICGHTIVQRERSTTKTEHDAESNLHQQEH